MQKQMKSKGKSKRTGSIRNIHSKKGSKGGERSSNKIKEYEIEELSWSGGDFSN